MIPGLDIETVDTQILEATTPGGIWVRFVSDSATVHAQFAECAVVCAVAGSSTSDG